MSVEPSPLVLQAMERVYAVVPDEFMATRKALVAEAKAAGAKADATAIGKLRKPTQAAWAINTAVRQGDPALADLAGVGERLRAAQSALDVKAIQALRGERDKAVSRFVAAVEKAATHSGAALAGAGAQSVRDTAIAALASEDAMAAVLSGALAQTMSYSGFGEVDVSQAVTARTSSGAVLSVVKGGKSDPPAAPATPTPQPVPDPDPDPALTQLGTNAPDPKPAPAPDPDRALAQVGTAAPGDDAPQEAGSEDDDTFEGENDGEGDGREGAEDEPALERLADDLPDSLAAAIRAAVGKRGATRQLAESATGAAGEAETEAEPEAEPHEAAGAGGVSAHVGESEPEPEPDVEPEPTAGGDEKGAARHTDKDEADDPLAAAISAAERVLRQAEAAVKRGDAELEEAQVVLDAAQAARDKAAAKRDAAVAALESLRALADD
ncbi:MAG: hypothetical protein LWW86_04330 [Micrococcales bacterium]|nr:hypothetical protein [Micrococcales bacterium]